LKGRLQISSFVFYGLTVFMVFVSVFSFIGALTWLNKPFPGFVVYKPPLVGSMSVRDWPGKMAGLKFMNRIVTVNGQQVRDGDEVVAAVKDINPGTLVHYVIESKGTTRELDLPVVTFSGRDFFLVFFLTFLGGIILFVLGVIVYALKANKAMSWVFFLQCFFLGGYMVTAFDVQSSYYFLPFSYLTLCFMSTPVFHIALIFPERKRILARFPFVEYLIYVPALIMAVAFQIYLLTYPKLIGTVTLLSRVLSYPFLGTCARLFLVFCVLGSIILVFHSSYRASTITARKRARVILLGVTVAFLPSVLIMILVNFGKIYFPYNFIVLFVLFFPASIAYSIVRHNLFDADVVIRRTVGYVVVTGIVVGAYALVSVALNVFMGQYQLAESKSFPILFTLGVILVFNPLRNRIQSIVDRIFFRKEYDYNVIIDKISSAITSLLDLGQILKRLTQTFMEDMFINNSSIMLLNPATAEFQVYIADGEGKRDIEKISFKQDNPLIGIIEKEKKELTKYDVLEDPKYSMVSDTCTKNFEILHASLIVPLVFQNQVIGSLNLGEKKSGKFYNREDIELLRTLANQGAVAIENARLFQESLVKERMEEELSIAHDLQASMLPAQCPEIDGFQIAAISLPAREVGGDFYDFIDMGEERHGLVIGDVTGKSVSGALVVSAARSVFRMLSEEKLGVGEIMTRANRRAIKDIEGSVFISLLYAVLNAREKKLSLCSAGQTLPIQISGATGEARLMETEGDTFPLGILEEADYQETYVHLSSGDKVILYTDGIVEAMNEKKEMFGFDRLLEIVRGKHTTSSESLLKEIIDQVNLFTGNAPQHDDLTVIVLSSSK